jgi:predicted nucleic acid-binding protein
MFRNVPADASSLIYLAKADAFELAGRCVESIVVPPVVWVEAIEAGREKGASEVSRIEAAHKSGFLQRAELSGDQQTFAGRVRSEHRLGHGESEVLALGWSSSLVLIDEGRAGKVARALGINALSTLFLPVLGTRRGSIPRGVALRFLQELAVVTGARAEAVLRIQQEIETAEP